MSLGWKVSTYLDGVPSFLLSSSLLTLNPSVYFKAMSNALEIKSRTQVVNAKITYAVEVQSVLRDLLTEVRVSYGGYDPLLVLVYKKTLCLFTVFF